ncbi:hypothetical protein CFC21_095802 [Triticum aestivum]|uniref:Uncharacterized protein n=1 Tax=Triticum aestivum TaxID=4565 RepID=A0A9R1MXY8_WHEAT|nr:hypothetical protein CFC21_095802 [Triticum aestivum]
MDRDRHRGEDRRRHDTDGHHHHHKARDSVGRRDSADREPPSRKRKDHDSGREGGKRPRASVDPPPQKEERPRRERKKLESGAANGDPQRAAAPNRGALNSAPAAAVPSAYPVPSKVYSITTTTENRGVSIRSDEVTGKSSADGTANSSAGTSSNLSLDALAKAKKALHLKKELSEKLKRLPVRNLLGTAIADTQIPSQEIATKMGFRQDPQYAPHTSMFPGTSSEVNVPVLRFDAQGREIDEHGNVISVTKPSNLSTLKVNINKQKKDAFQIIKPDLESLAKSTVHFDERMCINPTKLLRPKRPGFLFIEEGKLLRQAELQRIKFDLIVQNQFGEAQAKELKVKQAQLAKAKVEADMNPNLIEIAPGGRPPNQKPKEEIPDIEPWDSKILISATYEDISLEKLNMDKITIYVQHPEPLEPPAKPMTPPPQPLKLTNNEQKKYRTQRRLATKKDRQEMIRKGLLEPPKPKLKMSNLMEVLGAQATQDPTRMEMEIRAAAAEREQAHVDRNIARKLTPSERREKKERKLFDDPDTLDYFTVCVYRIRDLSHSQTRFEVDMNARDNRLTGAAVTTDGISVVVVEGGVKSIKRYNNLMLNRIDWAAAVGGEDAADEEPVNSCALVWRGSMVKPAFPRWFGVRKCLSEASAKKVFVDAEVPHYWNLAVILLFKTMRAIAVDHSILCIVMNMSFSDCR